MERRWGVGWYARVGCRFLAVGMESKARMSYAEIAGC